MNDLSALVSWLENEKEWLFSGLGLSFLAAICFSVRWLIALFVSENEADHLQELLDLRKHVDTRFDVLAAWIQMLHRERVSRTSPNMPGFHEAHATFQGPRDKQTDTTQGERILKDMRVWSLDLDNWPGPLPMTEATETHLDQIRKRNQRASIARKGLHALGWVLLAASILCFAVVVF